MDAHENINAPAHHKSDDAEIADDIYPYLRRYKDGRVERLMVSAFVPPSEAPGPTGVDPHIGVSVRLFLNVGAAATTGRRLPLIVYFHGGSFCTGGAPSPSCWTVTPPPSPRAPGRSLSPENPIPAAYEDAWTALRWAVALSNPWLADHADPVREFLAGESCGGNIVHNVAVRAATTVDGDDIDLEGLILLQPYFWGPERLPTELDWNGGDVVRPERVDTLWPFLTAGAAGNDDPRLNPPDHLVASSLPWRALVAIASKDLLWERGCRYAAMLNHGERCREVKLVESKGEVHGFHLYRPARPSAVELTDNVVNFINKSEGATNKACRTVFTNGPDTKVYRRPGSMARNAWRAKPPAPTFGLIHGQSTLLLSCPTAQLLPQL
jgi:acetyl esterase/lipase